MKDAQHRRDHHTRTEAGSRSASEVGMAPRKARDRISVITLSSRGRRHLNGVIETVARQDYDGQIELLIIGDNAHWEPNAFAKRSKGSLNIRCLNIMGDESFAALNPVERVSSLRNIGLALVEGAYFCFLDDDNRWEPNHLSSLMGTLAKAHASAAHSWRQLRDRKGRPWVANRFPWICDADRAAELFSKFTKAGMLSTKESTFRDSSRAIVDGADVGAIDMGAPGRIESGHPMVGSAGFGSWMRLYQLHSGGHR